MPDYEPIWYWVRERESVRLKKEAGELTPWTDDPILRAYRFCCVRREDDRVTTWVRERVRDRFADHPDLWFMLCLARIVNWPDTLVELLSRPGAWPGHEGFSLELLGAALEGRAARGDKVFTGAYIVSAPSIKGTKKTTFVAHRTLGALWRDREKLAPLFAPDRPDPVNVDERRINTLRSAHRALTRYDGWGPFLAYQAVVDMRFCRNLLAAAPDVPTWAAAGPGTVRGLHRAHGRAISAALSQERALGEMLPIFEACERVTGVSIDLSDVPNLLCETDKYLRVKRGEGAPRARYIVGRGS